MLIGWGQKSQEICEITKYTSKMNLFGKKNQKPKQPTPQASAENVANTIRLLRDNLETLEKREVHISKKMDVALAEAKQKAAKGDKKGDQLYCGVLN